MMTFKSIAPADYTGVIEHCPNSEFSCPSQDARGLIYMIPASVPAMVPLGAWMLAVKRFDLQPNCEVHQ